MTVQPASVRASTASARLGVGEDRGDGAQRADPVHRDRAELAGIGQDVGVGRVRDDRAPGDHLGRVVVGQPGLGVHAAGPEERLVGVELGEEGLGLGAVAGRVAGPYLPAAQQQVDLSRSASSIATGTEFVSTRPRNASGSARATSSAVVPMSMTMVSPGSTSVAASRAMACLRGACRVLRAAKLPSLERTDRPRRRPARAGPGPAARAGPGGWSRARRRTAGPAPRPRPPGPGGPRPGWPGGAESAACHSGTAPR